MKGQKTGGRKAGTPNRATAKLKAAAQKYDAKALKMLALIMETGESETARIAAAKELLDRGHGRAPQALTDADGDNLPLPTRVIHEYLA